jgi:hypothetical protein
MEHFIWQGYFPGSGFAFAEAQKGLSDEQSLGFLVGNKIENPPKSIVITELSEGELPDLLESAWSARMVSAKLKKVLEKNCPDCIQYIPVKLEDHPNAKYWIANVLTSIECVDREKSKLKTFPKPPHTIKGVSKLVLKPIGDDAPALFRIAELTPDMLVSEALRKELEAASSSAGRFTRVQDYRHPPKY